MSTPPVDGYTRTAVADDLIAELARLTQIYGSTDRRNGTSEHDYAAQARQAAAAVRRAQRKKTLSWRHVLAERYWAAIAQPSAPELRRLLVELAAYALLWAAALDRRAAAEPRSKRGGAA